LSRNDRSQVSAEGAAFTRGRFHEPYGVGRSCVGSEFEGASSAGEYAVKVFNGGNAGKYALAVGKTERSNQFTRIGEMIKAATWDRWFFK
jgi:hypothetical protein